MKHPLIFSRITSTPWAILPAAFEGIARAISGESSSSERAFSQPVSAKPSSALGVAVVPISGIIGKHLSSLETECGGCCLDRVQSTFDAALADSSVGKIVLWFDSPGGTVPGVPELASHMRNAAKAAGKTLYAYTDTLMASAAYWLATACDRIGAAPTATIGSIGVYIALADHSEAHAKAGVKINLIKAGKYKDMGSSHRPLSKEEQMLIQDRVDSIHAMFVSGVSTSRKGVQRSALEGQTFMGSQALSAGLIDELSPSITDFVRSVQSAPKTVSASPPAATSASAPIVAAVKADAPTSSKYPLPPPTGLRRTMAAMRGEYSGEKDLHEPTGLARTMAAMRKK